MGENLTTLQSAWQLMETASKGVLTNAKARQTSDCQKGIAEFLEK